MTDIIMQAYRAIDEIAADPRLAELNRLNERIRTEHKSEIEAFKSAREAYERVESEGGSYHPDYRVVARTLSETKQALYRIHEVKRYFELERQINDELEAFLERIAASISPEIRTSRDPWKKRKGGTCNVR
ncbi:MAG: YlbF family regulator [Acholeplasmataceae bacterium]